MINNKEKIVLLLVLIYIIGVSIILIYKINEKPVYDQALFDEICSQYEMQKKDSQEDDNINSVVEPNCVKKQNPTYMSVEAYGVKLKVIGKIIINKIDLEYPIIAETTDEYLKLAPTKLAGPLINSIGNLCIVGHNYVNNKLFSNLPKLQVGDEVILLDNNDNQVNYRVYDKYIVPDNDLRCMEQDTNGEVQVTLITCTNRNNERLIVKCRKV